MTYCLMSIEIMISHFTCGVLGAAWRSVFALVSAATAPCVIGALLQHISTRSTHMLDTFEPSP